MFMVFMVDYDLILRARLVTNLSLSRTIEGGKQYRKFDSA